MKIIKLTIMLIAIGFMTACKKEQTVGNFYPFSVNLAISSNLSIGGYHPEINPANFVSGINNLYFPQVPGDTFYYKNTTVSSGVTTVEDIYVTATHDTKLILGVTCEVIHDVVKVGGTVIENTFDYYAQDVDGNVWYFGENTMKLEDDGTWSTEGTFIAGVDGALPGKVMLAHPEAHNGQPYRQEYYVGHAEDKAKIVNTNTTVTIGYGTFTNCIKTQETTILDPGVIEYKWYAPGLGLVKASVTTGGDEFEELISTNH